MEYCSTRNKALRASPAEAVLAGLAPDGGLYVAPELGKAGDFDWQGCLKKTPLGMAAAILSYLLPDYPEMEKLVERAYMGKFSSPDLTPLVPVGYKWALELYHGPTSAFKDVALSMLPQLMSAGQRLRGQQGETLILTATSGDTGKAALEGFRDVEGTRIIVFFPADGVSPVQKAQMLTQEGGNVTVCGVRGNFDDCQSAVKEAFAALRAPAAEKGVFLSSANSINIGRLAPQLVYYFIAYARLLEKKVIEPGEEVDYIVPTGNFGDILAGYYAKMLGLPVGQLVCASNANRVLTDFFETGVYDRRRPFILTSSPSMDILISSNLERLLFYVSGGDTELVARSMESLRREGQYRFPEPLMEKLRSLFSAGSCDEAGAAAMIGKLWREDRYLCDPHTAVAFAVAEDYKKKSGSRRQQVVLSTASPYKFPDAVLSALGSRGPGGLESMQLLACISGVPVPENLASLPGKPLRHRDVIDREEIVAYVERQIEGGAGR